MTQGKKILGLSIIAFIIICYLGVGLLNWFVGPLIYHEMSEYRSTCRIPGYFEKHKECTGAYSLEDMYRKSFGFIITDEVDSDGNYIYKFNLNEFFVDGVAYITLWPAILFAHLR